MAYDKDFSLGCAGLCGLVFEALEIVDELAKLGYRASYPVLGVLVRLAHVIDGELTNIPNLLFEVIIAGLYLLHADMQELLLDFAELLSQRRAHLFVHLMEELCRSLIDVLAPCTKKDLPKGLDANEFGLVYLKGPLEHAACHNLAILFIDVDEVPFKALVHDFGNVAKVKLQKGLEE